MEDSDDACESSYDSSGHNTDESLSDGDYSSYNDMESTRKKVKSIGLGHLLTSFYFSSVLIIRLHLLGFILKVKRHGFTFDLQLVPLSLRVFQKPFVQVPYRILTEQVLCDRQSDSIEQVTTLLGIPENEAEHVLRQYKW